MTRDPRTLPIYQHADELMDAVRNHRVVVVEGPTGSGKTTQLPRMLLREGFVEGVIGVTQPRRIAAVSVAWRLAEELGVKCGEEVGFAIRFDDQTSPATMLKIMTDGLLLQEARTDPDLNQYGLIMVDEAHERSLNIDFTLGLMHDMLKRREDLRVVVSSATLNPEQFQHFFKDVAGEVPLISVGARTFPLEIHYRKPPSGHPSDIAEHAADQVAELHRSGQEGHVLVFMTGEAMIRETESALIQRRLGSDVLILPLYSRLTREEQERVFADFPGQRKVVLATNIAETSITIPDVNFVVDCGLAKIPRFNTRTGVTSLREEPISQASMDQRAGRAGRTGPGQVIRLYTKSWRAKAPEFTDEEIRRLDLSEVVLRLIDLGVHDVEHFPFPTSPARGKLIAALRTLQAMGAIDHERNLTEVGRRMVPFPLTPSLARMVVEAQLQHPQAVDELLIVGSFLSGRSPWLYPEGEEREARAAQERFSHPLGDALTSVRVYRAWEKASDKERFCTKNYLDENTMGFIAKAHGQLVDIAQSRGVQVLSGGKDEDIAQCVATGFADKLLRARRRGYITEEGVEVRVHPSSSLYRTDERYLVASELILSRRVYARQASVIKPEWLWALNPELAQSWKVPRGGGSKKAPRDVQPEKISELVLQGTRLKVKHQGRGKKARVDIRIEQVSGLLKVKLSHLPDFALRWHARILGDGYEFGGSGMQLVKLIALLPLLPLPEPGETLQRDDGEGLLLEVDRNMYAIERELDSLLTPMLPRRGTQAGWRMLVSNGAGGYWFEVIGDFQEALETTYLSLHELTEAVHEADPAFARIEAAKERTFRQLDPLLDAIGAYKRGRRKRKRKG